MTSTNDSSGAMPTDEAKPNWSWLQEKLDAAHNGSLAVSQLNDWFESELASLEEQFADFVTPRSRCRDLKRGR